jgi:integrase/recombinase XerD
VKAGSKNQGHIDNESEIPSREKPDMSAEVLPHHNTPPPSTTPLIPAFDKVQNVSPRDIRRQFAEARVAWLHRSSSVNTREDYARDLDQFLTFAGIPPGQWDKLAAIRPYHVAAWRDSLRDGGLTNSSIRRKLTTLRSLFSYLQTYGYAGANPAHSDFVEPPAVPRDGKTVGLAPDDCRRLLDAPDPTTPAGVRDRTLLAALAYSACRVGEMAKIRVGDFKMNSGHRILEIFGKGGKERRVPLHPEAVERIELWLDTAGIRDDLHGPLFRPTATARGRGFDGFWDKPLSIREIQRLIKRYALQLKLDPAVTVHSLRVTAITTGRERGADILDLQGFAGHADPITTLSYIRSRDRLSKSPAYLLNY